MITYQIIFGNSSVTKINLSRTIYICVIKCCVSVIGLTNAKNRNAKNRNAKNR